MRILVVFTGGTIGSFETAGNVIAPGDETYNRHLLALYAARPGARAGVRFDTMEPLTTLSENMAPDRWNTLVSALRGVEYTLYDGVIVTHGTDTLAYTAALLALLWQGMDKPLWLVSAGLTLSHPDSNGVANFAQAVEGIAEGWPGVWAAWRTKNGQMRRIPGYALRQCDLYTDEFEAADDVRAAAVPPRPRLYTLTRPFEAAVACLRPYPGIDYTGFQPGGTVKAVLHETYHAGTAPAQGASTVVELASRCRERGIAIYAAPLKPDAPVYASAARMWEAGVKPLPGITWETAYAWLTAAYSQGESAQEAARLLAEFAG